MAGYKNTKPRSYGQYMKFEEKKATKVTVSDWTFATGMDYLFRCYIIKINGEEADKIWTVWDYESAQKLKKKLGATYLSGSKELTVTMKKDENDETYFEIK